MKIALLLLIPLIICSCTTVNEHNNYGFFPAPGMDEDSQDRHNTKYNMMDSPDGSQDPNAHVKIWGTKY